MYDIKVTLQNIGKVDAATIEFKGVTVLTGKSNTGKSTVSKVIYSLLNVFNAPENKYYHEKFNKIIPILQDKIFPQKSEEDVKRHVDMGIFNAAGDLVSYIDDECKQPLSDDELRYKLAELLNEESVYDIVLDDELIKDLQEVLTKPYDDFFWNLFNNQFNSEFNGTACNVLSKSRKPVLGTIGLEFDETNLSITLDKNGINNIDLPKSLPMGENNITYLDSPFILDELNLKDLNTGYYVSHHADLVEKLLERSRLSYGGSVSSSRDKFFQVYQKINEVCEGEITIQHQTGRRQYTLGPDQSIPLCNMACSVKVFALLKIALRLSVLNQWDILMLDGIEAHLPPSEQKLLAEILMMLHREHKIRVFVNTQSPYFLRAIEFFAEQYDVAKDCKYYHAQEKKGRTRIKDVSSKLKPVYAELQEPFELNL